MAKRGLVTIYEPVSGLRRTKMSQCPTCNAVYAAFALEPPEGDWSKVYRDRYSTWVPKKFPGPAVPWCAFANHWEERTGRRIDLALTAATEQALRARAAGVRSE